MLTKPARLVLENGIIMHGSAIGAFAGAAPGELVFNTAMTGYQEILTDPSYSGQIVTFTYPHIGNYGVNEMDVESDRIQAAGIVVYELEQKPSNYRATEALGSWLERHGASGIEGLDTRRLVRILRNEGAMRAVICHDVNVKDDELLAIVLAHPPMSGLDLTGGVTTKELYTWEGDERSAIDLEEGEAAFDYGPGRDGQAFRVAAIDFGIKRNILRRLSRHGCSVTVFPATVSESELRTFDPDGIFLSNGPGDPAAVAHAVTLVRSLLGYRPVFGICLGHQILALAIGASTYKLRFGHRGANHPVRNNNTGRIEVTSQNHGFAVDSLSLPQNATVTHVNLNDNTCAGIRLTDVPAFGVQYHPEASPGPHDSDYLFAEFVNDIKASVETNGRPVNGQTLLA